MGGIRLFTKRNVVGCDEHITEEQVELPCGQKKLLSQQKVIFDIQPKTKGTDTGKRQSEVFQMGLNEFLHVLTEEEELVPVP